MKRIIRWIKRIMIAFLVVIAIIAIGLMIFLQQPQFGQPPTGGQVTQSAGLSNYNGKTFHNKDGITTTMSPLKALSLIPKWLSKDGEKEPTWSIPIKHRQKEEFESIPDSLVRLTWFGHSAFLLEIEGKRLLLDPMFGPRPSPLPFGSDRFNDTLPLAINDLPPIDVVLFSHDHYDHLDYPSVLQLKDKAGHFYVPLGLGSHLRKWGVPPEKITELDWWQEVAFGHLTFACTPAQHFSGRGFNDRDKTLWSSWVIKGTTANLFFSGDSGYFEGFRTIGEKYGPFDFVMMECGQYNELWQEIHMMPEETLQAHLDLNGKVLMPIHWGAFNLSLHRWTEPVERLLAAARNTDAVIATPMIGESVVVNGPVPDKDWWVLR